MEERRVARQPLAAVSLTNTTSVFSARPGRQRLEDPPDARIQIFDDFRVVLAARRIGVRRLLQHRTFCAPRSTRGGETGRASAARRTDFEKERTGRVVGDERYGTVGQLVIEIAVVSAAVAFSHKSA